MRLRATFAGLATLLAVLALSAVPALAKLKSDGGEGAYGDSDDVVVTNFGFALILFFVLLVTVLSIGQYLLERRKRHK